LLISYVLAHLKATPRPLRVF